MADNAPRPSAKANKASHSPVKLIVNKKKKIVKVDFIFVSTNKKFKGKDIQLGKYYPQSGSQSGICLSGFKTIQSVTHPRHPKLIIFFIRAIFDIKYLPQSGLDPTDPATGDGEIVLTVTNSSGNNEDVHIALGEKDILPDEEDFLA